MPNARVAAATIIAANYLPQARVLAESLHRFHPDVSLFVLIVDDSDGSLPAGCVPLRLGQIGITDANAFRAGRTTLQLSTAAKPLLLQWLLGEGFANVLFIDPDMLVVGDLSPIFDAIDSHSIVLTPHLLTPPRGDDRVSRELIMVQSGVFNGGLIGVSRKPEGERFLAWWRDRLEQCCRDEIAAGAFYDQRWLDLVPPFFGDVGILRDRGCDVAYWNLRERDLRVVGDAITVDGQPCRCIHFSGFDLKRPRLATRYAPRLRTSDLGDAAILFRRYAALLRDAGHA